MRRALALAAVSIFSSSALATETRLNTLQALGGVQDEVQVFDFPARLEKHRIALVELGTAGNQDVYGAAFVGKSNISGGVALSRSDWLLSETFMGGTVSLFDRYQNSVTGNANNGPLLPEPSKPVELLGAFRIGGNNVLGLRLAAASFKRNDVNGEGATKQETKLLAEQVDVGLGFSTAVGAGALDVGFTTPVIARQSRTEKAAGVDSSTTVKAKSGATVLDVRWLASAEGSGPYAGAKFARRSFDVSSKNASTSRSSQFAESALMVEGGYAAVLRGGAAKGFAGASYANTSSKGPTVTGDGGSATPSYLARDDKASVKASILSAALAGEADVTGGFGAMLGMEYALHGTVKESDKTSGTLQKTERSVTETSDAALWSLGVYYKQEAMRVDATYSKAFLHNGPFLIAGTATTPLFGRISASYEF